MGDVTIIPLEINEHKRAFLEDKVDAIVTFEPVRSQLLAEGAHQIFDSSQIPGEIVDVVVIHDKHLREHEKNLKVLLNAWFRSLDYLETHSDDAVRLMETRLMIAPDEIRNSYKGLEFPDLGENIRMLEGNSSPMVKTAARLAETMRSTDLLKKDVKLANLPAPEFLNWLIQNPKRSSADPISPQGQMKMRLSLRLSVPLVLLVFILLASVWNLHVIGRLETQRVESDSIGRFSSHHDPSSRNVRIGNAKR